MRGSEQRLLRLVTLCSQWKLFQNFKELEEQPVQVPTVIDYRKRLREQQKEY